MERFSRWHTYGSETGDDPYSCLVHGKRFGLDGRAEGGLAIRYQAVILGGPSPLPTASFGKSRVAGGFGTGGWGKRATSSGMGGEMSFVGRIVPAASASGVKGEEKG